MLQPLVTKVGELERMSRTSYPQIFKEFPPLATIGQEDKNGEINIMAIKDIDSYDLEGN